MQTYALYLESGPRRRRTMVHALDLLGCIATAGSTDEALAVSEATIRDYLAWLRRVSIIYGSPTRAEEFPHADEPFAITVAEHVTTGRFLGTGSPSVTFAPELQPLGVDELRRYVERLEWQRADLLTMLAESDAAQLDQRPAQGRSIRELLQQIAVADLYFISTITSLPSPRRLLPREADVFEKLGSIRAVVLENLLSLSDDERSRVNQRGRETWTARKALRRCLEFEHEQLREISRRTQVALKAGGVS